MFCHKCGAQIAEGAAFCQKCGTKVVYEDTYTSTGFGVRGALIASTLNAGAGVRIGTGFGPKQRCFVEIFMNLIKQAMIPDK